MLDVCLSAIFAATFVYICYKKFLKGNNVLCLLKKMCNHLATVIGVSNTSFYYFVTLVGALYLKDLILE